MEKNKVENSLLSMKDQPKCTIVMYHYVRNMPETDYPEIKGLLVKEFLRQLNYIQKNYKVISLQQYLDFLNDQLTIPENSCILTFDDGFRDHYKNVFPLLREKGVPGTFFIITQPLTDSVVVVVHKVHFLLAKIGAKQFTEYFNHLLKENFPYLIDKLWVDDKAKKERKYRWDDNLTANLKYSVSIMPEGPKNEIMNKIFLENFENEKEFSRELYMNFEEIKEMLNQGMEIGAHTHTHPVLSQIPRGAQLKEINISKKILERELGEEIKLFSYSYGGVEEKTAQILKGEGYKGAVTTNKGVNQRKDINPFLLRRLDTNDLPFGRYDK